MFSIFNHDQLQLGILSEVYINMQLLWRNNALVKVNVTAGTCPKTKNTHYSPLLYLIWACLQFTRALSQDGGFPPEYSK